MCKKEYAKTPLAKQKHAEFMLKMAEIIYGIILTGMLGISVLVWFRSNEVQTNSSFGYYLCLSIVGLLGAFCLQRHAMAIFNQPADDAENSIPLPATTSSDTANKLGIQIQNGNTHIGINIQPEKK